MRTLVRWAARLYPPAWRNRYAAEFDALLDDISPSFRDVCDVLGDVLRVRATTSIDACLMLAPVSPMNLRLPVVASLTAHAVMITIVLFAVWGHVTTMPFLSLPDIGATYRQGSTEWRVWPAQALESFVVRRVLPEYPHGTNARGAVSVFLEYLITRDGSVKVLRTSGPQPFAGAARVCSVGILRQH